MRILFVIRSLANAGGGAERVLAEVTAGLVHRGHEVHVATFDRPGSQTFYPLAPEVRLVGLGVGDPTRSARPLETTARVVALRRFVRGVSPRVVVGFMHSAYVPLAIAITGLDVDLVASDHIGMHHYRDRPAFERALVHLGQRRAALVTVPSEAARASFGPARASSIRVVPNPVRHVSAVSERARRPTVLTVGRLEPQKDHRTLLEAFARAGAQRPDWDLEVVGDGPLRDQLEALAAGLGIGDRVRFLGVVADVDGPMRTAGVLAVPSRYESFGLATAEALVRGLPAVGFADCPGTDELILDGINGLLVAGSDRVAALAEGLGRLMDDGRLRARLGAAAPATIARFAPEAVIDVWEHLLGEVTTGPGARVA